MGEKYNRMLRAIARIERDLTDLQQDIDEALDERAEEEREALHEDGWRAPGGKP